MVGGGVTGLAAAHRLLAESPGLTVTILEAGPRLGGSVVTDRVAGVPLEGGPDSVLTRKPWALDLMRTLGLEQHLIATRPVARGALLWWDERLIPIPRGTGNGVPGRLDLLWRSGLLSAQGRRRAVGDSFLPNRLPAGDVGVGIALRARFGREVVERLAAPMLAGIYAGEVDRLSLDAVAPHLRDLLARYGSLSRGVREARRRAPQAGGPLFQTLESGLATFVEALARRIQEAGGRIVVGARAVRLVPEPDGVGVETADGRRFWGDVVVSAFPAWAAAECLPQSMEAVRLLRSIPYANLAVVGLVYPLGALPVPRDVTGVLVPRQPDARLTALTFLASKWGYRESLAVEPIRAFYGTADGPDILALSEERLRAMAIRDTARILGVPPVDPAYARVFRHPRAMPQYVVGHQARLDRLDRELAAWPRLTWAGNWRDGVGMPDAVRSGEAAAARTLETLGLRSGAPSA